MVGIELRGDDDAKSLRALVRSTGDAKQARRLMALRPPLTKSAVDASDPV